MIGCTQCGSAVRVEMVSPWSTGLIGVPVVLVNAATQYICTSCGDKMTEIPDTNGLVAAVAITRCLLPLSLSGAEIKFVRKALEMTGREFAELMETRPETVSRWETDDQAIGGFVEKILRQKVCERLKGRAPAVDYEPAMIIDLTLLDHRKSDPLPRLVFERVLFKSYGQRHKALHWDVVTTADVKNAA